MDEGLAFPCKNAFLREPPADSSQYEDAAMPRRILASVFEACSDVVKPAPRPPICEAYGGGQGGK